MSDITRKLMKKMLDEMPIRELSPLMKAALNGESTNYIARETVKLLDAELKENGKDTFTIGDLRRIQRKIFAGRT